MEMDYRELLRCYIAWVKANAGTDYISGADRAKVGAEPRTNFLDDDEWDVLQELAVGS